MIAWAIAIFAVSATPGSALPGGFSVPGHLIEYGVLGLLLYGALLLDLPPQRAALLAVVFASAYGISDEFHQSFVPLRMPTASDWMLDTVGASVAVLGALLVGRLRQLRRSRSN